MGAAGDPRSESGVGPAGNPLIGPIPLALLPPLNAFLNGLSAVLLAVGFLMIRQRRIRAHRAAMVSAFVVSCVFLASYLTYHAQAGTTHYTGVGFIRPVYFTILITHTALAALVPPLAIVTLVRALRERFDKHRKLARVALPIWMYVSLTGVVIYLMLRGSYAGS